MARLSSPIETLKEHYAVVVIGSGYGAAIAASRLARAGKQVCVLERGREFQPGEYPNRLHRGGRRDASPHAGMCPNRFAARDSSIFTSTRTLTFLSGAAWAEPRW